MVLGQTSVPVSIAGWALLTADMYIGFLGLLDSNPCNKLASVTEGFEDYNDYKISENIEHRDLVPIEAWRRKLQSLSKIKAKAFACP